VIVRHLLQHEAIASRRAVLGGLASATSVLALGGCAGLSATGASYDASSFSADPTLLVATTRKRVNGARSKPWFGPERASAMTVARARVVPPDDSRLSLASVGLSDWRLDGVGEARGIERCGLERLLEAMHIDQDVQSAGLRQQIADLA